MPVTLNGTNGLLQNYTTNTPTTGFAYTVTTPVTLFTPAGTLATGTVTMPASPNDGMTVTLMTTQNITALTVSANTGQSITGAVTTLSANDSATYMYRLSNTTWYPYEIAAQAPVPNVQQFDSSGTWTKPTGYSMAFIQVWAGGGGGGKSASANDTSGGGGGEYSQFTVPLSYLASSVSITVGTGGAGSTTAGNFYGATGGNSSVPLATAFGGVSTVIAYGGTGGANTNFGPGSGGGTIISVDTNLSISCSNYGIGSSLGDPGGLPNGQPKNGKDNIFGGGGGLGVGTSTGVRIHDSVFE